MTPSFTPNKSRRITAARIRWIVMHNCGGRYAATKGWVFDPRSEVSYHEYITRAGKVETWVPDELCAWACGRPGKSAWQDVNGVNSWTLNVAFENLNDGKQELTPAQIAAAKVVIARWRAKHPTIEGVITHMMCATPKGRKHDPEAAPNFQLGEFL